MRYLLVILFLGACSQVTESELETEENSTFQSDFAIAIHDTLLPVIKDGKRLFYRMWDVNVKQLTDIELGEILVHVDVYSGTDMIESTYNVINEPDWSENTFDYPLWSWAYDSLYAIDIVPYFYLTYLR